MPRHSSTLGKEDSASSSSGRRRQSIEIKNRKTASAGQGRGGRFSGRKEDGSVDPKWEINVKTWTPKKWEARESHMSRPALKESQSDVSSESCPPCVSLDGFGVSPPRDAGWSTISRCSRRSVSSGTSTASESIGFLEPRSIGRACQA
eukprot:3273044-Prymnesium_polylepis.2